MSLRHCRLCFKYLHVASQQAEGIIKIVLQACLQVKKWSDMTSLSWCHRTIANADVRQQAQGTLITWPENDMLFSCIATRGEKDQANHMPV